VTVEVAIALPDGTALQAIIAVPSTSGPHPLVIAVHEAFGIDESMRAHVDRLAAAGYVVVMPDLFTRGGALKCLRATFQALTAGSGQAFDDIEATRQWALKRDDTSDDAGVIGFCLGGGFALMLASRGYNAVSVNYAVLPVDLDAVLEGACPVVASFGAKDKGLTGAAQVLEEHLLKAGVPHDVKEYPGAGHSFLNPYRAGPRGLRGILSIVLGVTTNPDAAPDAWRRIEEFFALHLDSST
jgi:carboxymethylenebutenolidase